MELYKIVIVGNGKVADGLYKSLKKKDDKQIITSVTKYSTEKIYDTTTVIVHVGSGRQYKESLESANKSKSYFIQASTTKEIIMEVPLPGSITFINAPNLSLYIIKFFHWLKIGADLFENEEKHIIESHQANKLSLPGTAVKICELLNIPTEKITSIRDKNSQKELQIKNLNQHAFHRIAIGSGDATIQLETKIEGMEPYAEGLYSIILILKDLSIENYEVENLVEKGYL